MKVAVKLLLKTNADKKKINRLKSIISALSFIDI